MFSSDATLFSSKVLHLFMDKAMDVQQMVCFSGDLGEGGAKDQECS